MASKVIRIDRRQHPRDGIVGQIETITYAILRKYGITDEVTGEVATGGAASFVGEPRRKFPTNQNIRPSGSCFHQAQGVLSRRRSKSRLRNVDRTMSTNLAIIASNAEPNREPYYPRTWLLYGQGQNTVEVHVAHDSRRIPHVVDRSAA